MRITLVCLMALLLGGCQTASYKNFGEVEVGAEKGQVLNLLGNPDRTYRKSDTDRWVYRFPEGKDKKSFVEKEVWFQQGHVVYRDDEKMAPKTKKKPGPNDYEPVD